MGMAFMHAMQCAYSSLESGIDRIMRMVGERGPEGPSSHADKLKRMRLPIQGKRPALISDELYEHMVLTLRFRPVAAHTYDDFDWRRARPAMESGRVIAGSIARVLMAFRAQLDPSDGEDGSGGDASGGPPARPR